MRQVTRLRALTGVDAVGLGQDECAMIEAHHRSRRSSRGRYRGGAVGGGGAKDKDEECKKNQMFLPQNTRTTLWI